MLISMDQSVAAGGWQADGGHLPLGLGQAGPAALRAGGAGHVPGHRAPGVPGQQGCALLNPPCRAHMVLPPSCELRGLLHCGHSSERGDVHLLQGIPDASRCCLPAASFMLGSLAASFCAGIAYETGTSRPWHAFLVANHMEFSPGSGTSGAASAARVPSWPGQSPSASRPEVAQHFTGSQSSTLSGDNAGVLPHIL